MLISTYLCKNNMITKSKHKVGRCTIFTKSWIKKMFILKRIELKLVVMSRRSIFFLAAAVVMLYFSIILFMLNPLHGSRGGYYGGGYMSNFAFRHDPPVNWCSELRWRSPPSPDVVALVSYPGSGNTWLRYLLQQVTGKYIIKLCARKGESRVYLWLMCVAFSWLGVYWSLLK